MCSIGNKIKAQIQPTFTCTGIQVTNTLTSSGDISTSQDLNVAGDLNISGNILSTPTSTASLGFLTTSGKALFNSTVTVGNHLFFGGLGSTNGVIFEPPVGGVPPAFHFGGEVPIDPEWSCGGPNPAPVPSFINSFSGEFQINVSNLAPVGSPLLKMGSNANTTYLESRSAPLTVNKYCKNYIYLLGTRIGFGTEAPTEKFHFSGGNILVDNSSPTGINFTKLFVKGASDNTGVIISTNHVTDNAYNTKLIVDKNETKALSVLNTVVDPNGYENFLVMGNGKTNVGYQPGSTNNALLNLNANGGEAINVFDGVTAKVNFVVFADGKTNIGLQPGSPNSARLNVNLNGTAEAFNVYDQTTNHVNISLMADGRAYFGLKRVHPGHIHANSDFQFHGKLACKELVVIDPIKWADFVFDKNYALMPLSEVEAFYKTNKHLKDVPSEKEVKENGINTAEMDATLLQKVEELYLYIVEQNKRIETLEAQNKKLFENK